MVAEVAADELESEPVDIGRYVLPDQMKKQLLDEMIWVEGGSFEMGTDEESAWARERPKHTVTVDGFYIGQTEVSQALFQ